MMLTLMKSDDWLFYQEIQLNSADIFSGNSMAQVQIQLAK